MFAEMKLAAILAKAVANDTTTVPAEMVSNMDISRGCSI